ncbi:uncharacterized protein LOC118746664 [Rhagoletis pomonella]|uniref:uncharacterized protein LOC118746664 n=1 Tax=Rhagoletis pomonella TaxID=28610 RepID=UPI001784725A|nr:uncharacterized protein LOC118746664 [Rhagoletis pomonella]
MNGSGNPALCSEFRFNYSNERPTDKLFIEFRLKENLPRFSFGGQVDILRADNRIIRFMDATTDGCKLLNTKNKLFQLFSKEIIRVSNFPRSCPLSANKLYFVRNYSIDPEEFPVFLPTLHWIVQVQILKEKVVVASVYLQGTVKRV